MEKAIIFYDSECIMCSRFALLVFKYDKNSSIYFSSLDSELFKSIKQNSTNFIPDETVVFYNNKENIYYKSEAVLKICRQLKFPLNLFVVFNFLPTRFLNWVYGLIAVSRKKWFENSNEKCSMLQSKFSDRILK